MLAFKEEIKYSDTVEINWWEKATLDGVIWKLLWLRRKSSTEFWKWEGGMSLAWSLYITLTLEIAFPELHRRIVLHRKFWERVFYSLGILTLLSPSLPPAITCEVGWNTYLSETSDF